MFKNSNANLAVADKEQPIDLTFAPPLQPTAEIQRQLADLWHEVNKVEHNERLVNTTLAADWVLLGESALAQGQIANARRCCVWATHWLKIAEKSAQESAWGYLAIAVELLYLLLVMVVPVAFIAQTQTPNNIGNIQEMLNSLTNFQLLQIPLFLFVWGFLGGVVWCLYSGAYWARARLFNKEYLVWYIAHPWVSAILGAGVGLLILAGLTGITGGTGNSGQDVSPFIATLSLTSFVAGFSTRHLWNILDQIVRKLFDNSGSKRIFIEDNVEKLRRSIQANEQPKA